MAASNVVSVPNPNAADQSVSQLVQYPRVWPAVVLIAVFWAISIGMRAVELPTFFRFGGTILLSAFLLLGFTIWWFVSWRRSLRERLIGVAALLGAGAVTAAICWPTFQIVGLLFTALPAVFTTGTIWLVAARKASASARTWGLVVVIILTWAPFNLLRMDGIWGGQQADIHWRWTPTAEQLFLAERANRAVVAPDHTTIGELKLGAGDWPGYRGSARDGAVTGIKIATDWDQNPPRQLWKQRVGPAWSSMAVVGDRLFTQEQRGQAEAVVCLDANTGHEVWSHEDGYIRFEEGVSGAGPRATPTFAHGRILAQGATGILNCLDANTGQLKWSRNIAVDAESKLPQWGFTASPLVVGQRVIAYAGGDKGLLAYDVDTGTPAWYAKTGTQAYTSPQLATLCGEEQILLFDDKGLLAVNPVSGAKLWTHDETVTGAPRAIQPHAVTPSQLLISSEADLGTVVIDVTHNGTAWETKRGWVSRHLKPSFNDYVVHDGFIYGFDGGGFCCVDLATGKPRWRERAYGYGQVVLLADQGVLIVTSEEGDAVLVAARPNKHEELGRFKAIEGKTWNHPAISNGRLYVRNAQEIACYQLRQADSR